MHRVILKIFYAIFFCSKVSPTSEGGKKSQRMQDKKIKHCFFVHSSAVGFFFTLYMSESNRDKKLVIFSSSVTERGATEEGKKEKLPKEALPPKNIPTGEPFFSKRARTVSPGALTCVCTVTSCVGGGVRSFRQHNSRKTTTVAAPFSRKRRGGGGGGGGVVFSHGGKGGRCKGARNLPYLRFLSPLAEGDEDAFSLPTLGGIQQR